MFRRLTNMSLALARGTLPLLVLIVALPVLSTPAASAAEQPKSVLILFSGESKLQAQVIIEQSLLSTLNNGSPAPVEVYSEYLDFQRTRVDDYEKEMVGLLRRKYAGHKFDLIIAVLPTALGVLLKNQSELFPDTPIVFLVVDQRNVAGLNLGPNVTGVWGKTAFKPNVDLALALHPNTRKVVVVAGVSDYDKNWTAEARKDFLAYEGKLEITYLLGLTIAEQQQALASLPQHTIVILLASTRDNAGNNHPTLEVLSKISPASNVPIYGFTDVQLGSGIVGGSLLSYEAVGAETARLSLRVLAGEKPQAIAPYGVPNVVMFDWRQLRRWRIDESKLPAGSIVRYKEFSVWELYKWRIIGAITLIVLQALGIVWLLFIQAKRRQAEKKSARFALLAEAEHQHLDEIVANVPGIVWEARVGDGDLIPKTTFISPYLGTMLGYTAGEWLSEPGFWLSVIVEEDREHAQATVTRVLESGEDRIAQLRYLTKEGCVLWTEAHLTAICDENGKPVGLRGVTMNISDRQKAEAALQENQAQLAAIIGSAMDAIISIDERQRVVLFNSAAEGMFGCSETEAVGQPFNHFVPKPFRDARQDYSSNWKQANGNGIQAGSFASLTGRRTTGEEFPVDVSISEVELNGARFFTIILRDTTERLRAEQALRLRKEELSEAQRIAKIGSWEWDPTADVVTWSEEMFQIMGRDTGLPAPSYAEHPSHYTAASWQRLKSAVEKTLQDGTPYEIELEMIHADGSLVWTNARGEVLRDATGTIVKIRGTLQDIAERKRAEAALQKAMEEVSQLKNKLEEENIFLLEEIKLANEFNEIVGRSDATKYVLFKIEQVAPTDSTVLITGETGTGKELVARAIHSSSLRKDRPLVRVNCAALSPTLIESELFGHEKGAFTGATARKIGRFELANEATIFLDEIGELPLELQAKLLRVIQEGEFERLGSSRTIKVDARIIAATNRNLKIAVEQGIFREDLWYRLHVFPITVPPLRDRKEDIPGLVEHFVKRFSQKIGRRISSIPPASMRVLQDYDWPGNVRELANVLERAVINTNGPVLRVIDHFENAQAAEVSQTNRTLEEIEKEYIMRILDNTGWRIEGAKGAARILGLNPSTLRTRMAKLGIQKLDQSPTLASSSK